MRRAEAKDVVEKVRACAEGSTSDGNLKMKRGDMPIKPRATEALGLDGRRCLSRVRALWACFDWSA